MVIVALAFSISIMVSILQGTAANQAAAETMTSTYSSALNSMQNQFNKTATLIECSTASGQFRAVGGPGVSGEIFSGQIPAGGPIPGQRIFQAGMNQAFVNETVIEDIRNLEGVKHVVAFLESPSNETIQETMSLLGGFGGGRNYTGFGGGRNFTVSRPLYTIRGVPLESAYIEEYDILPANITAGRNLQEGDSGVCLLTSNLTAYFEVNVGDTIPINGTTFTVIGVYEPANSNQSRFASNVVYMNLADAQAATDLTGQASELDVYTQDPAYVSTVSEAIELNYYDELFVTTNEDRLQSLQTMQTMYQSTLDSAESSLAQSQATATQEIIIAIAATSLIVLFVMLYTVRERTKEIGTLKAIGFSSGTIMNQFVLEGTLLSLIAGAVGIAIGFVAAPFLSSLLLPSINLFNGAGRFSNSGGTFIQPIQGDAGGPATFTLPNATSTTIAQIDPTLMLIAFGIAILLGVLGSLYPAWRAARIRPAEAMRYE